MPLVSSGTIDKYVIGFQIVTERDIQIELGSRGVPKGMIRRTRMNKVELLEYTNTKTRNGVEREKTFKQLQQQQQAVRY